jgi:hypothetical protein
MSFVTVQPKTLFSAAGDLQGIVEDAQITAHVQMYQAVTAHAAPTHEAFVSTRSAGGESFATTEAANATVAG